MSDKATLYMYGAQKTLEWKPASRLPVSSKTMVTYWLVANIGNWNKEDN